MQVPWGASSILSVLSSRAVSKVRVWAVSMYAHVSACVSTCVRMHALCALFPA